MREQRTVKLDGREVRELLTEADAQSEPIRALEFAGHAAVFNQRTWIGSQSRGFYEQVDPAFFRDVLSEDTPFLVNHDPNIVLARNNKTMSLSVDGSGLVPNARFDPADPEAAMWAGRIRRGDVTQMSFSFGVAEDRWADAGEGNGKEVRTLLTASHLYDVSLVTYPAYGGTDGGMRSAADEILKRHRGDDARELDEHLSALPQDINLRDAARLLGRELRVGATLSAATMTTLQKVLDMVASADEQVDAAQPLLADLMGVANPDDPDAGSEGGGESERSSQPSIAALRHRLLAKKYALPL